MILTLAECPLDPLQLETIADENDLKLDPQRIALPECPRLNSAWHAAYT